MTAIHEEPEHIYTEDARLPATMEEIKKLMAVGDDISSAVDVLAEENMNPFYHPSDEEIRTLVNDSLHKHSIDMSIEKFNAIMGRIEVILQTQRQLRDFKITDEELTLVKDNYDSFFNRNNKE